MLQSYMMKNATESVILVVDDDDSVRGAIADYLSDHGYEVVSARTGTEVDRLLESREFDLVVLDIMLPGEDGLSICERIASDGPPVLLLSALGSTKARILGLESGGADYLPKPFEPRELLARVRAVLRRNRSTAIDVPDELVRFRNLTYHRSEALLLKPCGTVVQLTAGDLRLLEAFVSKPGRLLSRDSLITATHLSRAEPYERAIDLAVSRLRAKLTKAGADDVIETVRGIGYRFQAQLEKP